MNLKVSAYIKAAILFSLLLALQGTGEPETGPRRRRAPARPPLLVMKQGETRGRVFFLADEEDDEAVASGVLVEVWTPDGKDPLFSTATDKEGGYALPSLAVGLYMLKVGALSLEVRVLDPDVVDERVQRVPKKILVYIPRTLSGEREG